MASNTPLLQDISDAEERREHDHPLVDDEERPPTRTSMHTLWPNLFFLTGGIFYVWIAIWDLTSPLATDDDENDSLVATTHWSLYDVVTAAAPFLYLINAIIDFHHVFLNKMHWELAVTTIFGMAALLDLAGALVYGSGSYGPDHVPSSVAVHFYLIQAILAVWGGSHYYENRTANSLLRGGYLLFLVGSLIDVSISYMDASLDEHIRRMQVWYMVSSSLWLMDALLYILAYFVDHCHRQRSVESLVEDEECVVDQSLSNS